MAIPEPDPEPPVKGAPAVAEQGGLESLKAAAEATQGVAATEAPPEA